MRSYSNEKPRVADFVDCTGRSGRKPRSQHKGLMSALLAVRNDEDPRLGPGAQAKVFNFGRAELSPLKQFLAEL